MSYLLVGGIVLAWLAKYTDSGTLYVLAACMLAFWIALQS